jgi:hypothetical protein
MPATATKPMLLYPENWNAYVPLTRDGTSEILGTVQLGLLLQAPESFVETADIWMQLLPLQLSLAV